MAISQAFIDELLNRIDIVELIDQRLPLRKRGSNYIACCPFHTEKTPSFTVSHTKQIYHCFGCGAGGNAISFLLNYDRLSFTESIVELANIARLPLPKESNVQTPNYGHRNLVALMAEVTQYYQQQLKQHPEAHKAIDYLKQRGINGTIAKNFALGYAPSAWDNLQKDFPQQIPALLNCGMLIKNEQGRCYDRFRERIMFPIRNQRGQIIGFGGRVLDQTEPKYLNSPETDLFHKGNELYGIYEAYQANKNKLARLLVVEGYMDVIALTQYDINYAVATLGTATTDEHLKKLFKYCSELIFCFDGDTAGQAAAWKALELSLPFMDDGRQVRFLILPDKHDPDSYVRMLGTEKFIEYINSATSLEDFLFETLAHNLNTESPAGQAKFVQEIGKRLLQLPKGALQKILLEKLARLVGLSPKQIISTIQVKQKAAPQSLPSQAEKAMAPIKLKRSLTQMAIAILIQHPMLASEVVPIPALGSSALPRSIMLLNDLVTLLKANPQLSPSAIIERWRDRPDADLLQALLIYPLEFPVQNLLIELQGAFKRINEQLHMQFIKQQLQKLKQNALSQEEKLELKQLLQARGQLQNS